MAEDDLLPPALAPTVPVADPAPAGRTRRIVCGFCDCELDPQGAILRRGEAAGQYLELADANKSLRGQLDTVNADNTELSRQLELLRNPPKRRGFLD